MTFTIGRLSIKNSYSKKNESAVTIRIASSAPPQKFQFVELRDDLLNLVAREYLLQEEKGMQTLSFSKIAKALHAGFVLCKPKGKNKANELETTKEQIAVIVNEMRDKFNG